MDETKPGVKTSELWGGATIAAALITAASGAASVAVQCVCYGGAALVAAAYILSRGIAKGGGA